MTARVSRRNFLKTAAVGAAAASFPVPALLAGESPNSKLNTVVIGCANQGFASLGAAVGEHLVALCDIDESHFGRAEKYVAEKFPDAKMAGYKRFYDYRKMFDEIHKDIDAVFIAAPDHHHASAAMRAIKLGKGVYVEKPLAHTIAECRALHAAAKQYKVVTQLGNQGHSGEGIRRLCEYIWAGAIGNVLETHSWAPTGRGGVGGRLPTKPVPAGIHWDEWIGPAPFREYHDELHPLMWRSWWDFGDGSVGDWGCHNLDGPFTALKLSTPEKVEAVQQEGGSDERYPLVNSVRWDFPARGDMPPVKVFWYDGYRGFDAEKKDDNPVEAQKAQNRPPVVLELEKKYARDLKNGGTIYVGDKGIMYTGNYAGSPRIIPEEKHKAFPVPEKKLPRVKGTHQTDFLRAIREGYQPSSTFDYAAPFSEVVLLGCLAERAGLGKPIQWDAAAMKVVNIPELNALVDRPRRKGWEL